MDPCQPTKYMAKRSGNLVNGGSNLISGGGGNASGALAGCQPVTAAGAGASSLSALSATTSTTNNDKRVETDQEKKIKALQAIITHAGNGNGALNRLTDKANFYHWMETQVGESTLLKLVSLHVLMATASANCDSKCG